MKVVLISGKAHSGKTKLGEFLVTYAKECNLRAIQTEYSKYLKLYAKEILNYDGNREKKPRAFLQDVGSFIREDLQDEHFFTRRMLEDFRVYENFVDLVVISDVRLIKEIEDLKEHSIDLLTIRVNHPNRQNDLTEKENNHITEIELDDYPNFDYSIENKSLADLEAFAKKLVEEEIK